MLYNIIGSYIYIVMCVFDYLMVTSLVYVCIGYSLSKSLYMHRV